MIEFQKNESAEVISAKPTLKDLLLAESPRADINFPKRGGKRRREAKEFAPIGVAQRKGSKSVP